MRTLSTRQIVDEHPLPAEVMETKERAEVVQAGYWGPAGVSADHRNALPRGQP